MSGYSLDVNQLIAKLHQQSISADDASSNDLHVDSDDILLDAENEKDDVAIITPDSDMDIDQPVVIRADDCMSTSPLAFSNRAAS